MGGTNQSTLQADVQAKAPDVLKADLDSPITDVLSDEDLQQIPHWCHGLWPYTLFSVSSMLESMSAELLDLRHRTPTGSQPVPIPVQTQNIRQHVTPSEIHFHDDALAIKVAVPAAEWFTIVRNMSSGKTVQWLDLSHNSVLQITPILKDNTYDAIISVQRVVLGKRFEQVLKLK